MLPLLGQLSLGRFLSLRRVKCAEMIQASFMDTIRTTPSRLTLIGCALFAMHYAMARQVIMVQSM